MEDKRELLQTVYVPGEGELVPPYSASYNSHSVQAWFPDYKTARVGGSIVGPSLTND